MKETHDVIGMSDVYGNHKNAKAQAAAEACYMLMDAAR